MGQAKESRIFFRFASMREEKENEFEEDGMEEGQDLMN